MAVVITLATSKGGCGKSTIAIMLAGAYAQENYRVMVIDSDPKQRVHKWAQSEYMPNNITVVLGDQNSMAQMIVDSRKLYDVIIIDVEGSGNLAAGLAASMSNIVLIPANPSVPDVEDAYQTVNMIKNQEISKERKIPYAIVWNRVPPAIRSREMEVLYKEVAAAGLTQLFSVTERSAYRALFAYQTVVSRLPEDIPGKAKAVNESLQLALAVGEHLTNITKKKEAA